MASIDSESSFTTGKVARGAFRLPSDSELITNSDEEVFLLYTNLQRDAGSKIDSFRGLGHVDSRLDILTLKFELIASTLPRVATTKPLRGGKKGQKNGKSSSKTVEIELAQDKTALRSRKGDTGSVLWKASVDFAQISLQQIYEQSTDALFDLPTLNTRHIVELGAGTGLLAIALSPFVRRYTVTDIPSLVPLLRKNVSLNFDQWPNCPPSGPGSNVVVEELDWVLLYSTNIAHRPRVINLEPIDVLLVVDCIYHPSLLPALVDTIDYLATPEHTAALVVVELRANDVIQEFLELWIGKVGWEIWRVGGNLNGPYAMWLGWKTSVPVS